LSGCIPSTTTSVPSRRAGRLLGDDVAVRNAGDHVRDLEDDQSREHGRLSVGRRRHLTAVGDLRHRGDDDEVARRDQLIGRRKSVADDASSIGARLPTRGLMPRCR
jgi:hypothetical protein